MESALWLEIWTYLTVLNLILVHVLGTGGVLSDVLSLGELGIELLAAVPAVGLGEAELRLRLLNGQRQFTERSVRLLRVEGLCQRSQVYKQQNNMVMVKSLSPTACLGAWVAWVRSEYLLAKVMGLVAFFC